MHRIRFRSAFLLLFSFLLFVTSTARAELPVPIKLRHVRPGTALSDRFLTREAHGEPMLELIVEGDLPPGHLRAAGMEVNTVAGPLMTVRCPVGLLDALLRMPGVRRVQVAERAETHLDRSGADVGAQGIRALGSAGFYGRTGKGVVVGLVDTGVDLAHPDFRAADGRTRVLALWDQTATGTPPGGFSYGAAYDSAGINAGLAPEQDVQGHGTHVLGIAAGNGSATGNGRPAYSYVGMAPMADVIAVKTNFSTSAIVDGVKFIFDKAAALGKRAVVNLSLGTQDGPHDGTLDMDLMLDALTGPGRVIVASAGNDGSKDLHGRLALSGPAEQTMTLNVPSYTPQAGSSNDYLLFSGWYPGLDQVSLTIVTPGGTVVGPIPSGGERLDVNTPDGYLNVSNGTSSPANGDREIYVEIYDEFEATAPRTGVWQFRFAPAGVVTPGAVDMYLFESHLGAGAIARWVDGRSFGGVVASPGSADSVITVAAHSTRDGWDGLDGTFHALSPKPVYGTIAYFSSQGPRRDGVSKPDLSAPGHTILSSKSSAYVVGDASVTTDGVHTVMSGTSMSGPHVAGAVALLLAESSLGQGTPSEIRHRLQSSARADSATGAVPNPTWGYGKLDIGAALAPVVTAVPVTTAAPGAPKLVLGPNRPNPFNPSTSIRYEIPQAGPVLLRIYAASGRLVRTLVQERLPAGAHEARWDGRDQNGRAAASGIYLYELAAGGRKVTRRMTLLK